MRVRYPTRQSNNTVLKYDKKNANVFKYKTRKKAKNLFCQLLIKLCIHTVYILSFQFYYCTVVRCARRRSNCLNTGYVVLNIQKKNNKKKSLTISFSYYYVLHTSNNETDENQTKHKRINLKIQ